MDQSGALGALEKDDDVDLQPTEYVTGSSEGVIPIPGESEHASEDFVISEVEAVEIVEADCTAQGGQ
jgi:hypothetical protein